MLPLLLVVLAADADVPAKTPTDDTRARDTAAVGLVTAVLAAGLAVLTPISDQPQPGSSPVPLIFGTTAFVLVALVRPVVFFSNQPSRPPPTALNNALRVIGSLTAVLGLGAFISAFVLRPNEPLASSWAMAGAAGLEALSAAAFSIDAELGLK